MKIIFKKSTVFKCNIHYIMLYIRLSKCVFPKENNLGIVAAAWLMSPVQAGPNVKGIKLTSLKTPIFKVH